MKAPYLAVTVQEGFKISPKFDPLVGKYWPVQGTKDTFKSPTGMKLYFSSSYWYFDTVDAQEVAWAAGVDTKVPSHGWKAPGESFPWSYGDVPLTVSLGKAPESKVAETMGAVLQAKPCTHGCSEGISQKTLELKQKSVELKQKTGEAYQRARDVHAPYVKQRTVEAYQRVRDVHAPYVKQRTVEAYQRVRDVHAPYVKQKTGQVATEIHAFATSPDTKRKTNNVVQSLQHGCAAGILLLRDCVSGIVLCLDGCVAYLEPKEDAPTKPMGQALSTIPDEEEWELVNEEKKAEDQEPMSVVEEGNAAMSAQLTPPWPADREEPKSLGEEGNDAKPTPTTATTAEGQTKMPYPYPYPS